MRVFGAPDGSEWDATVGRESWGTHVIIFSSRSGADVRKSTLEAESQLAAENELQAMTEDDLRRRLERSESWSG